MRIIDRYLMRGFIAPLLFCILLFYVLFVIIDAFNNIDEYIKYGIPPDIIGSYYFFAMPELLVQIIPIATLVALLFVLGNLNKHQEIVALKAGGVSTFQILSPYLFLGILVSFMVFLMNETVVPRTTITARAIMDGIILKGKRDIDDRAIKNVALYGTGNRMIFAREYQIFNDSLHDVVILENNPDQTIKSKLIAQKAQYENGKWVFYDVMQYELNRLGDISGEPVYSPKVALDLTEKPEDFLKGASQVEFMSSKDLKHYIAQLQGTSKRLVHRLWVDFHHKIALPFLSFIVILIGSPLAMRTERGSAMVGIGTSLIVVFLYYGIDSVCLALGKGGYFPPSVAAWLGSVLFAGVGIYLIRKAA